MELNEQRERKKLISSIDKLLEGPMILLGFIWLGLLVAELIWGLSKGLEYLSLAIWVVFIFDFIVKLVVAPQKWLYIKRNWLTAIALFVPAFRAFRILRTLRYLRALRGIRLIRVVSSVNRTMKSLSATMERRGFGYVFLLTLVVTLAGAAGMYSIEKQTPGFDSYGMALWWTAMRVITAGSEYYPLQPEGRGLAFIIALYGYAMFGYVTATLATFFIGRDEEEKSISTVGSNDLTELSKAVTRLTKAIDEMKK